MPHWLAHFHKTKDAHLDVVEYSDSPIEAEAECSKHRDATRIARANTSRGGLSPDTERV